MSNRDIILAKVAELRGFEKRAHQAEAKLAQLEEVEQFLLGLPLESRPASVEQFVEKRSQLLGKDLDAIKEAMKLQPKSLAFGKPVKVKQTFDELLDELII